MKYFQIKVLVYERQIKDMYLSQCTDKDIKEEDLPSIKELVEQELGWCAESGIELIGDIEEIQTDKSSISIVWSVPDIQGIISTEYENSISNEDALVVLEYLEDHYSPTWGITFQSIYDAIQHLLEEEEISLKES